MPMAEFVAENSGPLREQPEDDLFEEDQAVKNLVLKSLDLKPLALKRKWQDQGNVIRLMATVRAVFR
jgi:hypothetical protein